MTRQNFTLNHSFYHKKDECCKCFEFLDHVVLGTMTGMNFQNKRAYNSENMQYYPFRAAMSNGERFIPFGWVPTITVIDPDNFIFRLVSSRTYGSDSVIYFDKQLRAIHHIYRHKSPFTVDTESSKVERAICKEYPKRPSGLEPQYMSWTFKEDV